MVEMSHFIVNTLVTVVGQVVCGFVVCSLRSMIITI